MFADKTEPSTVDANADDASWASLIKGATPSAAVNPWADVEVQVDVGNRSARGVLQVAGNLHATSQPIEGTDVDGQRVNLRVGVVASFIWDDPSELDRETLERFVRTAGLRVILPYLRSNAEDLTNRMRLPIGPLDLLSLELGDGT
jgi:D-alanyl-D-alanine carboxypeptidase